MVLNKCTRSRVKCLHLSMLFYSTEQAALLSESEDVKKRDDRQSCEVTQQIEKEAAQKEEANYRNDAANVIQLHSKVCMHAILGVS